MDNIKEILEYREKMLNENYPRIKDIFLEDYDWPEIQGIKYEVCLCIMFGFYQAAITLTNHLLESFLKFSLTYYDIPNEKEFDKDKPFALIDLLKPSNKKYVNQNLFDNINNAFDFGLINEDQKKMLHFFRQKLRNAFSHADREKIYEDEKAGVQDVRGVDIPNNEWKVSNVESINIFDLPFANAIAQYHFAEAYCIPYITYLNGLIKEVKIKLFPKEKNED